MFVLDSNILIYFFKGRGQVAANLLATPPAEVALPIVALYELEVGIAKSPAPERRRRQLEEVLSWMKVLPFGREEAITTARIRAQLEKSGQKIGAIDTMIAGTALHHDATLVTNNFREFGRVPNLELGNWFDGPSGS